MATTDFLTIIPSSPQHQEEEEEMHTFLEDDSEEFGELRKLKINKLLNLQFKTVTNEDFHENEYNQNTKRESLYITLGEEKQVEENANDKKEIGTTNGQEPVKNITKDTELVQDDTLSHKKFKERAIELMKKTQGEYSHFVQRILSSDDWLFIHRVIRKSKGLKSKFMMKNLTPLLFDSAHVISWKCKFCHEMIPSPSSNYIDHLCSHHGQNVEEEEPVFPCDVCGEFVTKDKYIVHFVPHFMEYKCEICNKVFALHCHMTYHYKVVHEVGEQTCLMCGKMMKNDLAMKRHLRLFHSNRTNWKVCDICGKAVKSRCLEPHKLTHSHERAYKCDTCKKSFKTPSTLYQHQKVHATDTKAYKYLCEYCGKRFKHHTSWNLHVVRIHEGQYQHECSVCGKKFHKLFELKKHSVKHSDDRRFPCTICPKKFKTKTHLNEHFSIHSEKLHLCPLCGKGIRMKANLYKHLKVHRNRGEFVPSLSGKSSSSSFLNSYGNNNISNNTIINSKNPNNHTHNRNNNKNNSNSNNTSNGNNSELQGSISNTSGRPTTNYHVNPTSSHISNNNNEDNSNGGKSGGEATSLMTCEETPFGIVTTESNTNNNNNGSSTTYVLCTSESFNSLPTSSSGSNLIIAKNPDLDKQEQEKLQLLKDINEQQQTEMEKYNSFILTSDGPIPLSISITDLMSSLDANIHQNQDPEPEPESELMSVSSNQIATDVHQLIENDNDIVNINDAGHHLNTNNIISLIAHAQNQTLCLNGTPLTHLTILLNHNNSFGVTQVQSE